MYSSAFEMGNECDLKVDLLSMETPPTWTYEEYKQSGWTIEELEQLPVEKRPKVQTGYLQTICMDTEARGVTYNVWRKIPPKEEWDNLPGHLILGHHVVYHSWDD
eukprot:jgi/Mesvir1/24/Mv06905-RA.1